MAGLLMAVELRRKVNSSRADTSRARRPRIATGAADSLLNHSQPAHSAHVTLACVESSTCVQCFI